MAARAKKKTATRKKAPLFAVSVVMPFQSELFIDLLNDL
jgi:hypothetical protein